MKALLLLVFVCVAQAVKYTGHRVITVHVKNDHTAQALQRLKNAYRQRLDFWSDRLVVGDNLMIRVPPSQWRTTKGYLDNRNIKFDVTMPDLQQVIDEQKEYSRNRKRDPATFPIDLEDWNRHGDINAWMDGTLLTACGARCSVASIGQSFDGLDMRVFKITGDGSATRSIWVDSAMHAREWIAPSTVIWIMDAFVRRYGSDADITAAVNRFDWYFLPIANPDGYEYTHDWDRMWRKTLSDHADLFCPGADPNRNYEFEWGGQGSSGDPCSDTFRGDTPWSEVESRNIRDAVLAISSNTSAFVSVHSHGNYWLTPWGYSTADPPNYGELLRVGNAVADAIFAYDGTPYTVGSAAQVLYVAAGGSDDWAFATARIPYSYTPELPGRGDGFVPPASEIRPTGEETLWGFVAMAREIQI